MNVPDLNAFHAERRAHLDPNPAKDREPITFEEIPDAAPRERCAANASAKGCTMRARWRVPYHGATRPLCGAHARTYVEWGARDREQMARALWGWPTPAEIRAELAAAGTHQLAFGDDAPLPRRSDTGGIHTSSRSDPHRGGNIGRI